MNILNAYIFRTVASKCVSADVRYMSEVGSATVHDPAAGAATLRRRQSAENGAAVSSDTAAAKLQSKHNLAHRTRPSYQ